MRMPYKTISTTIRFTASLFAIGFVSSITIIHGQSQSISSVTVANVTPTTFTVFWQASPSAPSISVYADSDGSINLQGDVGIEYFPLHTGSPSAENAYFRRASKSFIRQKMHSNDIYSVRVHNCKPNTKYYIKIVSTLATKNQVLIYPESGLLEVKTPRTNSFVLDARQLIISLSGPDTVGRVLFLSHSQCSYPIAAIVGDGCSSTNAIETTSAVLRAGDSSSLRLSLNADVQVTNIQFVIQFSHSAVLQNPFLVALSPLLEEASTSISQLQDNIWIVNLSAKSGSSISGAVTNIATIGFSTTSGLSSTIVTPSIIQVFALKSNGNLIDFAFSLVGRIIIIGLQPILEAVLTHAGERNLIIYGVPGASYQIQSTKQIGISSAWKLEIDVSLVNTNSISIPLSSQNQKIFYRAVEIPAQRLESSVEFKEKVKIKNESSPVKVLPLIQFGIK